MAVTYNRLWKLLIDKGMNKTDLRLKIGMGTATLAKLSANEKVSLDVLEKICLSLDCKIEDVIEIIAELPQQ